MFIFALISALASATSAFSADNNDAAVERELQAQQTHIEAPAQTEGTSQAGDQEATGRSARQASSAYQARERRQVKADVSRDLLQPQYDGR